MSETISIPLWLAVLVLLLAAWAVLDRFLLPGARWFLRRRVTRVVDEINTRLDLKIQSFKLTRREVLIDRLSYDAEVMDAVAAQSAADGIPREVLMARVARYAHEIVPAFNAYVYFRVGAWAARRLAEWLYRVRLGDASDEGLAAVDPEASVVFVMNHRSNMDYVLVAYLAASRTALSYAVGEWARIWPLQTLIRSLGAYFVRRESGDQLYRRVLERYVAMATAAGVVQAVYPEGGLSRDGHLRPPRLGLLNYMLKALESDGAKDVVFIPVGINYDRVLEDRSLVRSLDPEAERRSTGFALKKTFGFIGHNLALMIRGRWFRFGYACVNFGAPVSARAWIEENDVSDEAARQKSVDALGRHLMHSVGRVVPVLPVSLIATVFARRGGEPISELDLKVAAHALQTELEEKKARIYVPHADTDYALSVGLRMLTLRHLIIEKDGLFTVGLDEMPMLQYYANAIAHYFEPLEGPE
ncbi:MAG: glycerol-3-phosphate acyltransferase [Rhodospirillaceae bacterium]|jgi:glycerol-3-phosphate O-acyltransferase|nr:glycerol-3-phosphate acyltransferase [Rhodospirillaceae bacterium]MBT3491366.1 glycerol-3-phosphate acyltransferase [Rhodospirillaceae bacterium]MBT3782889.1 glycerol-3-phosphate acyltransferase [Rhodospirillaceae bacterium]MBT3977882.1 glycerol-3-phosphate acyltransferase [Rhodospirillaceae bacterium]MBT4166946.1 glycerol-3-phosphate acyltransferase [Rhodospirillaceae bacterium]